MQGVTQDREGYALAAGMALGLITLGQGRDAPGLVGVRLEERLRYFMLGGSEAGTVGSQRGVLAASGKGNANLTDGVFSPNVIGGSLTSLFIVNSCASQRELRNV